MKIEALPLEHWLSIPEAAEILGLTKQAVHKLLYNGDIKSVRTVGTKPVYVVSRDEVEGMARRRAREKQDRLDKKRDQAVGE